MLTSNQFRLLGWMFASLAFILGLSGCTSKNSGGAAASVESYLQALVEKDSARLASLSCTDWEDDAVLELESLAAVTASLKDMTCQDDLQVGETAQVSCSGFLLANYNGEDQEINLSDRTYLAVKESGDWRMCGYK